jgi:4'-phosphopantetheinyl transferase
MMAMAIPTGPATDAIHVWQVDLCDNAWDTHDHVLAEGESHFYDRVVMASSRRDWRRCRIVLRLLLGRYLGCDPGDVRLAYGAYGKPALDDPDPELHFNVSHSQGQALLAMAASPVGVDIEQVREGSADRKRILRSIVAADEPCPADLDDATNMAFFRLWTRKEAFCKAIGLGLQKPMDSFRLEATGTPAVFQVNDRHAGDWLIHDVHCPAGWMGCVCSAIPHPLILLGRCEPDRTCSRDRAETLPHDILFLRFRKEPAMTTQDVLDIIIRCSKTVLPDTVDHVYSSSDRLADLGANSVDRGDIVMMVLDELSLRLPLTQIHGPKNIGELAEHLHGKLPQA